MWTSVHCCPCLKHAESKLDPQRKINQEKQCAKQNHKEMCREWNLRNEKLKEENEKLAKQNLGFVHTSMPKASERWKVFHAHGPFVILATGNCTQTSQDVRAYKICYAAWQKAGRDKFKYQQQVCDDLKEEIKVLAEEAPQLHFVLILNVGNNVNPWHFLEIQRRMVAFDRPQLFKYTACMQLLRFVLRISLHDHPGAASASSSSSSAISSAPMFLDSANHARKQCCVSCSI